MELIVLKIYKPCDIKQNQIMTDKNEASQTLGCTNILCDKSLPYVSMELNKINNPQYDN
jgi:hypothetical protein